MNKEMEIDCIRYDMHIFQGELVLIQKFSMNHVQMKLDRLKEKLCPKSKINSNIHRSPLLNKESYLQPRLLFFKKPAHILGNYIIYDLRIKQVKYSF